MDKITDKIYGYKQTDVISFAKFIQNNPTLAPNRLYSEYANISGKSVGTIRNLYYAVAKKSRQDTDFCVKYLNGTPLQVGTITPFTAEQERNLIKQILIKKQQGSSVRNAILEMTGGDVKLSLRYQNKYRGALKSKPNLISQILSEINGGKQLPAPKPRTLAISDFQMSRLKKEIDGLVDKISHQTRKENEKLKTRIAYLESENARLVNLVYNRPSAVNFFQRHNKDVLN